MNNKEFFIYLIILSGSTFLIRSIPFAAMRKKVTNKYASSFLYYVPYAVLAAMTFPSAFYATGNIYAAAAGILVGVIFAIFEKGLTLVAAASCVTVFTVDFIMKL